VNGSPSPSAVPLDDCWLAPDVVVAASPIASNGLFASADIAAGTVISRLGGRLVSSAELERLISLAKRSSSYINAIAVDDDCHLVLPPRCDNGIANHSCEPNLWWVDAFTLAARRDIAAGEELTNDYATATGIDGYQMPCACASSLCRGVVRGTDWLRSDLQERYGDHWIPLLRRRIAEQPQRS